MKVEKYKLSLQILEYLSAQTSDYVLKQNIISEPSSGRGDLERHFNITLTNREKNILALSIGDLQEKGLIEAVFRDVINSGNDLIITDKGRKALEKRVLDELDELLLGLNSDSDLINMRYGAYDAILNKQTDWQRQSAASLVELIDHTLRTIAPNDKVVVQAWYIAETTSKTGVTRKHRVRYYLEQKIPSRSKSDNEIIEKAWQLIEACRGKLEGIKHASEDKEEVEQLIKLAEDALIYLLKKPQHENNG